jgi:hypothetical protein
MGTLTDLEKLRRLIPHWIEHNQSHADEFMRWAARARLSGENQTAELIENAADLLLQAGAGLEAALDNAGGPAETQEHLDGHNHSA